ncbi:hypothetical protein NMG60_11030977 [Bertholletia excelsa]
MGGGNIKSNSQPSSPLPAMVAPSQQLPPLSAESPDKDAKMWGTHVMGLPAVPTVHPDNQKAAKWTSADHQQYVNHHYPYLLYSPVERPNRNPFQPMINLFSSWCRAAETIARNIWHHLTLGPSLGEAAWGKVNLTAKAIKEGGFESLFKQSFETNPEERLKKIFACYLSTTTGPVAGTLYLSTARLAFCSDRPLSFTAPSGLQVWSYYKVVIPWANLATVHPITMRENPSEKYIQTVTSDDYHFWFMGFVSFENASDLLLRTHSSFLETQPVKPAATT